MARVSIRQSSASSVEPSSFKPIQPEPIKLSGRIPGISGMHPRSHGCPPNGFEGVGGGRQTDDASPICKGFGLISPSVGSLVGLVIQEANAASADPL